MPLLRSNDLDPSEISQISNYKSKYFGDERSLTTFGERRLILVRAVLATLALEPLRNSYWILSLFLYGIQRSTIG